MYERKWQVFGYGSMMLLGILLLVRQLRRAGNRILANTDTTANSSDVVSAGK